MTAQGRFYYAIVDKDSGKALGTFSHADPTAKSVETYLTSAPKTRLATEAQYLLSKRYVFEDLGYRRYEWKCDALKPSIFAKQLSA